MRAQERAPNYRVVAAWSAFMILIGAGAFVLGMAFHNEARAPSPEIDRRAEAPFNGDTATRLVADPYPTTGGKIAVTASLRDDPLGQLFARRQIDEAQYRPGRMVEEWLELSEIGSVQAIDPAKEAVDGRGQYVEAITDKQIHAMRRLAHVRSVRLVMTCAARSSPRAQRWSASPRSPALQANTRESGGARDSASAFKRSPWL
jgi:hypothetical protein